MRLIDAYALKKELSGFNYDMALRIVDTQPTIDAEPVRHGRWVAIPSAHDTRIAKCSVCGFWQKSNGNDKTGKFHIHNAVYKYCSGCGAKMDGGADDAAD